SFTAIKNFKTLPLKLTDVSEANELDVFPNPAYGIINIRMKAEEGPLTVRLLNLLGQQAYSRTTATDGGPFELEVPLNQVAPGLYLIEVTQGDQKLVRKITVQ